jgi:GT2 family glycosyltransferase
MSVSVLIPSINGGRALIELVERLADSGDSEILIADNGLGADARGALRTRGAGVVGMNGNAGFGRALNLLAARAAGERLIVLNDDLEPETGLVERLAESLDGDVAMVAGVLLMGEHPGIIESAGIEVDKVLSPYDYLQGEPAARALGAGPPLGPCGGSAAYSAAAFHELRGFDEGFFAYCEDVDIAIRMRAIGGRCALAPRARARHIGSTTLGYHSLEKAVLVGESRGYLWRKYGVARRPTGLARLLLTELATCTVLYRRHRSWEPARARVRGFRRCRVRSEVPRGLAATVSFRDGVRRRYSRSVRAALPSRAASSGPAG